MSIPEPLLEVVRHLAAQPVVLVACDYDGTLAPIVSDPNAAHPCRESMIALRALAALPDTHAAVISGRSLRDLATLSRLPDEVHLVGSHGSEFDAGFAQELPENTRRLHAQIDAELDRLTRDIPGVTLERKPASTAVHVRNASPDDRNRVLELVRQGPGAQPGVHMKSGKMVLELTMIETDKGDALDLIRRRVGADAVIFLGDDVTDEDAFAVMQGPDVSVKVGPGESVARFRVDDIDDVAQLLALLSVLRQQWVEGAGAEPIENHSLLSNLRTVALVQSDARITWMCQPRPDSPSVFGQLLGGVAAGYFAIAPADGRNTLGHRYLDHTMVLETSWPGITVTDSLVVDDDTSRGEGPVSSREDSAPVVLMRVIEGHGRVRIEFAPRLDFGRAPTRLEITPHGLELSGSPERMRLLCAHLDWSIVDDGHHHSAVAEVDLTDEPLVLILEMGHDGDDVGTLDDAWRLQHRTIEHWCRWSENLAVPASAPEEVRRSALTLKALCHAPTGAILAAATTSLPEVIGGVRNWDYRLCWPRDASMVARTLALLDSTSEGESFLEWMCERMHNLGGPEQLRPVYPLIGDDHIPEAVIPSLHGYRGSRPVRIGNLAEHQVQLDVFGPIADLIHTLVDRGHPLTPEWWWLTEQMVEGVRRRWTEPDNGIWEIRRPMQHHVHSKVMCWQTVDRAIAVATLANRAVPDSWSQLRTEIAEDVLTHGWSDEVEAFTMAYGEPEPDAAVLHLALSGLLPADDPRFISTVAYIDRHLRRGAVVYRYRLDDGLPGVEGGFHICTSWLIQSYVSMGRRNEAVLLFERLLELLGPTGLLSEQYDPQQRVALGNHPQAYSHLGLIDAALALARSSR